MDGEDPFTILQFDDMVVEPLNRWKTLSQKIGGPVDQQANSVIKSFDELRNLLKIASYSKSPEEDKFKEMVQPIANQIQTIMDISENNRVNPLFNNLSVISNSIPALGWVSIKKTPAPYIKEMHDAGTFYSNKVMMEHKGEDSPHAEWIKTWNEVLNNMYDYVKKFNTTGLTWNEKGQQAAAKPAPAKPTPAPKPSATQKPSSTTNPATGSGKVPLESKATVSAPKAGGALTLEQQIKDKKPNLQLEGNRWVVEYHLNNPKIEVTVEEIKQHVYVYKCMNSTIIVKGKLNGISLDTCKKCNVVFDTLISQIDVTNSQNSEIQINNKCPLVQIENCDGAQVYLSKESMDIQVITAKATAINLLVPTDEPGDYKEYPLPEQYRTVWEKDNFVTTAVEKKG